MADPSTPEEWFTLVEQHRVTALAMVGSKIAAGQAYLHAGFAVECALKAYIMKLERLNGWPSREARPDLHTHDIRALHKIARIVVDRQTPQGSSWHVFLQWDRNQGYDPKPMPRKVAKGWVDAAFGQAGLVTWIRQNCL